MTTLTETLTMWVDSRGVPERMVWRGIRYRVTDTPTPLELDLNAVTHFSILPMGWRFQGTNDQGESLVFDVISVGIDQSWWVVNTYR
jgi:hypothetical protein